MIDRFLTRLKKKLLLKVTKNTREGKQRKKDTIFFQQEGQSIRSVCPWLHSRVSFSGIVSWCYLWLSSLLGGFIWLNIDCSSPRLGYNEYISIGRIVYPLRPRGPPPWIVFMGWYDADLNPNQLNGDSITSFFSLIFFFFSKTNRFTCENIITQSCKDRLLSKWGYNWNFRIFTNVSSF